MGAIQKTKARKMMEIGCRIASIFNPYIPKSNKRILFFESTEGFMNNYVLCKYMLEHGYNQKYKIFYFPDIRKTANIKDNPSNIYFNNSIFKAFILFLTTRVVILDTGNMRMIPSKKQKVVYLDHGLPFKRAGAMSKHPDKTVPRDLTMPVNYLTSSSSNFDEMYIKSYLLKPGNILRCGRPRTDAFFKKENHLPLIGIEPASYKKIVMWMTTYRISKDLRLMHTSNRAWSETNLPILINNEQLKKMNQELQTLNYYLVIKIHGNSVFDRASIGHFSNIRLLAEEEFVSKGLQIYDILKDFDALITDYSSVFLDYLLTNKPMIFVTDDIEDYKEANGFYFENPLDYMPGPKVNNFEELIEALKTLDNNALVYNDNRKIVRNFAHEKQDGRDCERLLKLLEIGI